MVGEDSGRFMYVVVVWRDVYDVCNDGRDFVGEPCSCGRMVVLRDELVDTLESGDIDGLSGER